MADTPLLPGPIRRRFCNRDRCLLDFFHFRSTGCILSYAYMTQIWRFCIYRNIWYNCSRHRFICPKVSKDEQGPFLSSWMRISINSTIFWLLFHIFYLSSWSSTQKKWHSIRWPLKHSSLRLIDGPIKYIWSDLRIWVECFHLRFGSTIQKER